MQTLAKYLPHMPPIENAYSIGLNFTQREVEALIHWISNEPYQEPVRIYKVELDWAIDAYVRDVAHPSTKSYHASLMLRYTRKASTEAEQLALIQEAMQLQDKTYPQRGTS